MPPKPKAEAPPAVNTGPYWVQVKYGRDQTQLFNSDCLAALLADHIKTLCGYDHIDEDIDLQKEDKSMVGLRGAAGEGGEGRASAVLAPKGVYYLCKLVVSAVGDGSAPVPELLFEEADAELEGALVEE